MVFLFCVALWFILRGASCFLVFPYSLSSCFIIPFSVAITSLVHLFVCFVHVSFCHFFLFPRCRGFVVVCDCGTPWTFLLSFFSVIKREISNVFEVFFFKSLRICRFKEVKMNVSFSSLHSISGRCSLNLLQITKLNVKQFTSFEIAYNTRMINNLYISKICFGYLFKSK